MKNVHAIFVPVLATQVSDEISFNLSTLQNVLKNLMVSVAVVRRCVQSRTNPRMVAKSTHLYIV